MVFNKKWSVLVTPVLATLATALIAAVAYLLVSGTSSVSQAVVLIASSIAAISSIWNTVSAYQNSVRLEELKQRLNLKFPALQETTNAAVQYYYTLSKLESGKFEPDQVSKAEEAMEKVSGKTFFLGKEYQRAWYRYWQKARFISESVDNWSREEAEINWRSTWGGDLATLLEDLSIYQETI